LLHIDALPGRLYLNRNAIHRNRDRPFGRKGPQRVHACGANSFC
jgi:hypothetical protein